ncbi:TonB-dependent receptor [uncultured Xylophilus sp.]|uniref:TonB-dependent receptor n=1 Tax=uncultured Xylophilus sp. TaxID=296832 RepID=UPI0026001803|nr:TonB-dependent receptor [uncultured Xylophilus sp.]
MLVSALPNPSCSPSVRRRTVCLVAGMAALAGSGWSAAQPAERTLSGVEVRETAGASGGAPAPGARAAVSLAPAALPASSTAVTAEDIADTNVGRDISNIFRRVPGVLANNIDQGETGNGFRMRGFATQGTHGADTAVYVDGVPQNIPSSQSGAGHGPAFLEWLAPDMIGRLDVIKGPVSALYGDQNRAGAVDIRTRDGGAATPSSVALGVERYGLRRASLVLSNEWQAAGRTVDSLLVADAYRNDGWRQAARTDRQNLFWKLGTTIGDGRYSLRVSHYQADYAASGYLALPALQQGLDPRSVQFNNPGFGDAERSSVVFNRAPAQGEAGWYATVYAEDLRRSRAIPTSATQHTVGFDDRRMAGARLANNWTFGERASLVAGAELRRDDGVAERRIFVNRAPTTNYVNAQDLDLLTYGVFAQGQFRPVPTVKLLAGLRHDRFDYDIANRKLPAASVRDYRSGVTSPKLGVAWTVAPRWDVFANVAQGFRSPAAEQISSSGATGPLGAAGGVVSRVDASKVRSYDLGFAAEPAAGWTAGGAVFQIDNDDEIVAQADGSSRSVGSTTRRGWELETRLRLGADTTVYGSYTRIAEARANNPAPNTGAKLSVPADMLKAGAQFRTRLGEGRLTLNADAYLIAGIPYYDGTPQVREREMPLYTRYDLRGTYDWRALQFTLYAAFQPHRFGTEIAYGTSAGLLLSPVPRTTVGASVRYFF